MTKYDKRFILSIMILLICFGYIYITAFRSSDGANDTVLGFVFGTVTVIVNFFFGSSDRKGKDENNEDAEK